MSTFSAALRQARDIMKKGGFRDAFNRIVDVEVSRPDEVFDKVALMSDAGIAMRDVSVLEYGLYLLDGYGKDILAVPAYAAFHWFNLANLRSNLLAVRESEGAGRSLYDRRLTAPTRDAYRRAAAAAGDKRNLKSRILSAHGRFLVGLGRDWEAFGLFHEATELDGQNADAKLGRIETLASLAGTAPALEKDLFREARGALNAATESNPGLSGLDGIRDLLGPDPGDGEPEYPRNTVVTDSDGEHAIVMFFLRNRLYLSPCSGCRRCDRSVGDAAVLGAHHAVVGAKVADRYRRSAILIGRIIERYRALRRALAEHHLGTAFADGANRQPRVPEVDGWIPIPDGTAGLISALAGVGTLMEGMTACAALYLGREFTGPVRIDRVLGTPKAPGETLAEVKNPALHGFWDLWADGMEGYVPGANLIEVFSRPLSSPGVEEISLDSARLGAESLGTVGWLAGMIGYLIRMADRDARGDVRNPPLWPLQPFAEPEP